MATILRCVSCGAEVMKKEVLLGRARGVDTKRCICANCLPTYEEPGQSLPVKDGHTDRRLWPIVLAVTALTTGLVAAGLFWLFMDSANAPSTVTEESPETQQEVSGIMNRVKEEYEKGGADTDVPPIRFPVGERGERIESYAEMARGGDVEEIRFLLKKAGEDSAKLREIIAGITRSENQEFLQVVRPYLSHESLEVRAVAVLAYGKIGDVSVIGEIEPFLEDENPLMRVTAEMAINGIKGSGKGGTEKAGL